MTVEAPFEHPFFVFGQGWSSVRPELSLKCYGLQCHMLAVGDVCVSLTVKENGKHGLKEESSLDRQLVRVQIQGLSSPELKRRRMEEKLVQHEQSEHHLSSYTMVQGAVQSRSSQSPSSPGNPTSQHAVLACGPDEGEERGIDKNFNIVPDKPPERQNVRAPKRRWSDPVRANLEIGEKKAEQELGALETLGKVQQQQ